MSNYEIAQSKEEWHELRSKGLGGSDIGTLLGVNPYKSKYQLWLEKTGQVESPDISDKIRIKIGNELEDLVARMFEDETGLKVQRDNKTHFHKDYPFLLANIDRKIIGEKALLECKTTSAFSAKQWKDEEIPASYLMQVQHYLNVLDYDKAYIAVIIGNHDFVWKEIERDDELINIYTRMAVEFWESNVLKGEPPEVDGLEVTKEALNMVEIEENTLPMSKEMLEAVDYIKKLDADIDVLNQEKEKYQNKIKQEMTKSEATELFSLDYSVTWRPFTRITLDSRRLKKEMPEIYQEFSKETHSKRFSIKER
ncbi:YqaJ viral recombinase family protein [Facklamia sp. P9177]|uniref:YqaJ viral recombinase family nuclease n=1 Tax=Facklamia sp. P9177 TaxID=3421945 RepID=UPI003D17B57D